MRKAHAGEPVNPRIKQRRVLCASINIPAGLTEKFVKFTWPGAQDHLQRSHQAWRLHADQRRHRRPVQD
jgi:hypothetical protein